MKYLLSTIESLIILHHIPRKGMLFNELYTFVILRNR